MVTKFCIKARILLSSFILTNPNVHSLSFFFSFIYSLTHSHSHTHTHSYSHTYTLTHSLSHTLSLLCRTEIEAKKQELRLLVGERYRELIEAADSMVTMASVAAQVAAGLSAIYHLSTQVYCSRHSFHLHPLFVLDRIHIEIALFLPDAKLFLALPRTGSIRRPHGVLWHGYARKAAAGQPRKGLERIGDAGLRLRRAVVLAGGPLLQNHQGETLKTWILFSIFSVYLSACVSVCLRVCLSVSLILSLSPVLSLSLTHTNTLVLSFCFVFPQVRRPRPHKPKPSFASASPRHVLGQY